MISWFSSSTYDVDVTEDGLLVFRNMHDDIPEEDRERTAIPVSLAPNWNNKVLSDKELPHTCYSIL